MYIFMLLCVFMLVLMGIMFVVQLADSLTYKYQCNFIPHTIIIAACVTFLVFYFGG